MTEAGAAFARGWSYATDLKPGVVTQDDLHRSEATVLGKAESFWVSDEMSTVIAAAAVSMPEQALRPEDLPSPQGFVWFDRPLYVTDVHGKRCGLRAASWATRPVHVVKHREKADVLADIAPLAQFNEQGIGVVWYSDTSDEEDEVNQQLRAEIEADGRSWDEYVRLSHRLSVFHLDAWPFGHSFNFVPPWYDVVPVETPTQAAANSRRLLAAFLTLQGQRLAHVHHEPTPRHLRRRMERDGTLDPTKEVRVVTLRRFRERGVEDKGEEGHPSIEWSHQWMVSGHWRNQWVPSINDHRLTWIAPYVKGPEDRPLLVKDTVFKLAR